MRIFLAAFGSFGDIQPFIWLGKNLRQQGHEIYFIANPHFQPAIETAGLVCCPAGTAEDYQEAARPATLTGKRLQDQEEQIAAARRLFTSMFMKPIETTCQIICDLAVPDSLVIGHNFAYGARLAAEKCRLPFLNVPLSTYWLQGFRKPRGLGEAWVKKGLALNNRFIDGQLFSKPFNALRTLHGLAPLRISSSRYMHENLNLCLFPDWWLDFPLEPELRTAMIGFPVDLARETTGELPADLAAFLQLHAQPLVFTPGSAVTDSAAFFRAALATLQTLDRPGIFLTREPAVLPMSLPDTVYPCEFVPLGLLLGQCAALIHHGGIGTMTQALLAGIPQVVCHRLSEQQENARQLVRLGVGRALPYRGITGESMTRSLNSLLHDPSVTVNCRNVRDRLMADTTRMPAATALAQVVAAV